MDYKTLLEYMEATKLQIICRTREQRAEAVDILKELNPSLDTTFISQKYEASEFPYMGYDGVTDEWALWRDWDSGKLMTVETLRELVDDHADEIELACGSLEDVL